MNHSHTLDLSLIAEQLSKDTIARHLQSNLSMYHVKSEIEYYATTCAVLTVTNGALIIKNSEGSGNLSIGNAWLLRSRTTYTILGRPHAYGLIIGFSESDDPRANVSKTLQNLTDLSSPHAIRAAVRLGLADLIAAGKNSVSALSEASGASATGIQRLLRYLCCRGVFQEGENGKFHLTEAALPLRINHQSGLHSWLNNGGAAERMDKSLSLLAESVISGKSTYQSLYGHTFWKDLEESPKLAESFSTLMQSRLRPYLPRIAGWSGWGGMSHIVDVGGGDGTLLSALLRNYTHLQGTLTEQPSMINQARIILSELSDRCSIEVGDFFEPIRVSGDCCVLAWVMRDWPDNMAVIILKNCIAATLPASRIVIVESIANGGVSSTARDLRMLTVFEGQERSTQEIRRLLTCAGLQVTSVVDLGQDTLLFDCTILR